MDTTFCAAADKRESRGDTFPDRDRNFATIVHFVCKPCSSCAVGRIISRLSGSLELPTKFQKIHETASSSSLLQIALSFRAISLPFQVPFPSVSLYANRVGVKKCRVDEVGAAVGVAA